MAQKTVFRKIKGRIVPVRLPKQVDDPADPGATVDAAKKLKRTPKPSIKPNRYLQAAGLGLAAGSGVIGALGAGSTAAFLASQVGSLGLGVAGEVLAINAYNKSGGSAKERQSAIVRAGAINQIVGWSAFGATLASRPAARRAISEYGVTAVTRAVDFARANPGVFKRFLK